MLEMQEVARNLVHFNLSDTSNLILVFRNVWFKEFRSFYSKLLFGFDTGTIDKEKEELVDKIINDELELLFKDIETGDVYKWLEWLAWFNTKQMLSQNIDPLSLLRNSKSKNNN